MYKLPASTSSNARPRFSFLNVLMPPSEKSDDSSADEPKGTTIKIVATPKVLEPSEDFIPLFFEDDAKPIPEQTETTGASKKRKRNSGAVRYTDSANAGEKELTFPTVDPITNIHDPEANSPKRKFNVKYRKGGRSTDVLAEELLNISSFSHNYEPPAKVRDTTCFTHYDALLQLATYQRSSPRPGRGQNHHIDFSAPPPWLPRHKNQQSRPSFKARNGISLHDEISAVAKYLSLTDKELDLRMDVFRRYRDVIRERLPGVKLQIFGSTTTGLGLPWSDLDLVLVDVEPPTAEESSPPPRPAKKRRGGQANFGPAPAPPGSSTNAGSKLAKVAKKLRSTRMASGIINLRKAKVPIIKLVDIPTGLAIDMSYAHLQSLQALPVSQILLSPDSRFNPSVAPAEATSFSLPPRPPPGFHVGACSGPAAAVLIKALVGALPELRPLVLLLKQFLANRDLNVVSDGGVGGYGCVLWMASFLKLRRQGVWPEEWLSASSRNKIRLHKEQKEQSDASTDLGTLWIDFCHIFGCCFDFDKYGLAPGAVVVRKLSEVENSTSMDDDNSDLPYQQGYEWTFRPAQIFRKGESTFGDASKRPISYYLSILDPLDESVDVFRNSHAIQRVTSAFRDAYISLEAKRDQGWCRLPEGFKDIPFGPSSLGRILGISMQQEQTRNRMFHMANAYSRELHPSRDAGRGRAGLADLSAELSRELAASSAALLSADEGVGSATASEGEIEMVAGIMLNDGMVSEDDLDASDDDELEGAELVAGQIDDTEIQGISQPVPSTTAPAQQQQQQQQQQPGKPAQPPAPKRRVGFNGRDKAYRRAVHNQSKGGKKKVPSPTTSKSPLASPKNGTRGAIGAVKDGRVAKKNKGPPGGSGGNGFHRKQSSPKLERRAMGDGSDRSAGYQGHRDKKRWKKEEKRNRMKKPQNAGPTELNSRQSLGRR
ncbi:hypothetical protein HDU96_005724 [Phlyctochytrium bullatum]|nr:hypothetical protein HDU96_005724 [Phlyctochytrium bullatum]